MLQGRNVPVIYVTGYVTVCYRGEMYLLFIGNTIYLHCTIIVAVPSKINCGCILDGRILDDGRPAVMRPNIMRYMSIYIYMV